MTIVATRVSSEGTQVIPAADLTTLNAVDPGGTVQPRSGGRLSIPNEGVLVAGGGIVPSRPNNPPPKPSTLVQTWTNMIVPPLPGGNQTNQIRPAPTGGAVINAPTLGQGQRTSGPLSSVFGQGSKMINAPGVPQFTKTPTDSTLATINSALTQDRINQFAALDPSQKMLARTMLVVAIDGLNQGQLTPRAFSEVVGLVLKSAQQTKFSTAVPQEQTNTSGRIPGPVERVPNVAPRPGAITANEVVPGLATRPQLSTVPVVATVPYPSSGPNDPEPAWWAQATNDPKDPDMGAKLVKLITAAREFERQAQTIDVNQPVNPKVSTKTPMQEWKEWAAA
jgi:hypothetical protein